MKIASKTEQHLGTSIEIQLPLFQEYFFSDCFAEIARLESAYSRFRNDSILSKLNKNLGKWQDAPDEFIYLLEKAINFSENTNGNFDITLKAVLEEMGYDSNYSFKPRPQKKVGFFEKLGFILLPVQIDADNKKVLLRKEVEFGGLGKGYAVDQARKILDAHHVEHYCINAGGDIFAKRGKNEEPWSILLEHPDDPSKAIGKINIDNCSIAGSAANRRKWGNYHHLLNSKTRKPAEGVNGIFVVAETATDADAYATALFCAGFEEGIELSRQLEIEVLIISDENKMHQSEGFAAELFK